MAIMTPASEGTCRLLTIAPELRNKIYELAFTGDDASGKMVDPFEASPPSKNLLLACRQTYEEARGIQRTAYRAYWSTTRFLVDNVIPCRENLNFTDGDLAHVQHVKLRTPRSHLVFIQSSRSRADMRFDLEIARGIRWIDDPVLVLTRCADGKWWCTSVKDQPVTENEAYCFRAIRYDRVWYEAGNAEAKAKRMEPPFKPITKKELLVLHSPRQSRMKSRRADHEGGT